MAAWELTDAWQGVLLGLVPAAFRSATPLLWALLGETLGQRAGVVNLGSEGQMLVGAASAFAVTAHTGDAWLGLAAGALAGLALSLGHALLCLRFGANQFASGIAIWMIGFGVSSLLGASLVGQSIAGFSTFSATELGRRLPLLGWVTPTIALSWLATLAAGFFVYRTRPGLALRAAGESRRGAEAAGLRVNRIRTLAIACGGSFCGVGGAALSIDYAQTWAEGMSQGRGLVAVGLVIVARYDPWLALPTALTFGAAEALVLRLQSAGSDASAHLLHMLPYAVSLVVLIATCLGPSARASAPAELRAVLDR
ncbi:MAG TPA: ABC transporter permease [Polyangiaceae bacterium]|nr:ABC transporter permease [Polyangiaceae bacterium]